MGIEQVLSKVQRKMASFRSKPSKLEGKEQEGVENNGFEEITVQDLQLQNGVTDFQSSGQPTTLNDDLNPLARDLDLDAVNSLNLKDELSAVLGHDIIEQAESIIESNTSDSHANESIQSIEPINSDDLELDEFTFEEFEQTSSVDLSKDQDSSASNNTSSNVKFVPLSGEHEATFSVRSVDFPAYRALSFVFDRYKTNANESDLEAPIAAIPIHKGAQILFPRNLSLVDVSFIDDCKNVVALSANIDVNFIQTKLIDDKIFAIHAKDVYSENIRRKSTDKTEETSESSAFTKELLVELVSTAVQNGCTDLHMYLREEFVVKFRADKLIQSHLTRTEEYDTGRSLFNSIINNLGAHRCSGSMNYVDFEGTGFPLQVFTNKQKTSTTTVELRIEKGPIDGGSQEEAAGMYFRILGYEEPKSLEQLKIAPPIAKMIKHSMRQPQGMILVVGPTGSGKTTLLHAGLKEMRPGLAARTIEDPVEIRASYNDDIAQMNVPKHLWQEALESILRQDPDVVMIGEIRSKKMLETLMQATLTGHLTLSTLHTIGAIPTLTRMIDIGADPKDLAAERLLSLIIATRLNNVPCRLCAIKYNDLKDSQKHIVDEFLGSDIDKRDNLVFTNTHSENCTCNKGQRGMSSMQEILKVNARVREFIRNEDWVGMRKHLESCGWKDFETQMREKILSGELDLLETPQDSQDADEIYHY